MPTIEISKKDLESLTGKKIPEQELQEKAILFAKSEIENIEGDKLKIDVKDSNRPDLWSVEGIARELRGYYGIEKGLPKFLVKKSGITAKIDPGLKNIRPCGAYAIAKNVKVSDEFIQQLIQMQEKICETFGRKRKEVAIGIFDADKVSGNVKYYAAKPVEKFVPLGYRTPLTLEEILQEHPKGKEYAKLLEGQQKFPLLVDSKGDVLSMPPIINSEHSGKVTLETKNLFIDVTGFKQETIETALEIVCAALADRGAKIESITVDYGTKKIETPRFETKKISVPIALFEKLFGGKTTEKELVKLAEKKRMNAIKKGASLLVSYPSYRADILHPVDIIEDLLIAYGYDKIEPLKVEVPVQGTELPETKTIETVRECCIGMQLQEVLTFTLTSREKQESKMLLQKQEFIELENPVSTEFAMLRKSIIPELLAFLSKNKHCDFPQKIFEIGKTFALDEKSETRTRETNTLCIALSGKNENYTSIKAHLEALCKAMNWKHELQEKTHPSFNSGRCALVKANNKNGVIGEISEKVLKEFELEMPVAVLEIEI
ncbi:MAG: phenylalanine--tRNA ligase subunit beta [Candidatus Diapherotrites archaeon]